MITADLQLLAIQVETLYRLDGRGRMLCVNEPGDPPAPRLFLGRTREGTIWRVRHDLPEDLAREIDRVCHAEPVAADLEAPPLCLDVARALLGDHAPVTEEWRGPGYVFPQALPDLPGATPLDLSHAPLLPPDFAPLLPPRPARMPVVGVVAGGQVAAVCFSARVGERACEAGVETLPEHRGRGYASAAVARWAALVRAAGKIPLYSTSWDNHASCGVARRLGLRVYGEDVSLG